MDEINWERVVVPGDQFDSWVNFVGATRRVAPNGISLIKYFLMGDRASRPYK